MSLLQNEEFVLYQLRTAYLSSIKDGVGERLINVNSSILNTSAFRAAGWVPNAGDIKRTYSPPIPTAVTSEYFQAPRSATLKTPEDFVDDEDEGGMVTGGGGSNDTVGPALTAKRRKRREQLEEDDSSDLSDESDDDEERPANQIKFTKMPLRRRADSSPAPDPTSHSGASEVAGGPAVTVTEPSRPTDSMLRRGSSGTTESIKSRARRDTVTSSEMSSENELDPATLSKRPFHHRKTAKPSPLLSRRIQEDEEFRLEALDEGKESGSAMSSDFSGSADTVSILGADDPLDSSPPDRIADIAGLTSFNKASPRKPKPQITPTLQALPPPRPISFVPPVSSLTQALRAKEQKPSNPSQRFASWNAASEANSSPLFIKIYCPFSTRSSKPIELLVRKTNDKGETITVAEVIGYALWRYQEEKLEPPLELKSLNINLWVLRLYDDGEIDDEFPPLTRNRPLTDFASNNSRGMRPRAREKPWDEFGLIEASEREVMENEKLTPAYSREAVAAAASQAGPEESVETKKLPTKPVPSRAKSFRNPITGPSFAPTATRKDTSNLADAPAVSNTQSASRTGAPRTVTVRFTDENFSTRRLAIQCTTDTYIDEVFDKVCRDLQLDKGLYVLKVSDSTTVAPPDRTVEALGTRTDLDLVRRRFIGDGVFGLAGSPGSTSPNAPLVIGTGGVPKKTKKGERPTAAVTAGFQTGRNPASELNTTSYKRWPVLRKQPMSFASSTPRILALDHEYIHIMPTEAATATKPVFDLQHGKTTVVHYSSVVGSKVSKKHPKTFRIIVYKEKETKRYDFEARSSEEATEIIREIAKGVERWADGGG